MNSNHRIEYDGDLSYRGYTGICTLEEDEAWYGRLIGISDYVDFIASDKSDVEREFREAVDAYIDFCEEIDKLPNG